MIRNAKPTLFFLLFVLSTAVFPQGDVDFINGVLLDSETNEPVVFATVRLKGRALGVISNNDGSFQVPTEFQLKGEELEISSMGYQTKTITFSDLNADGVNRIYLMPATFELAETVVEGKRKRRPTAKQIIRFAFERIPDNYSNDPFGLIGYYRDYQFKEQEYINLNEALVKVLDQGFSVDDYRSIQFGLFDYATNRNFKIDSFAAKPYDYSNRDKVVPNATFGTTYAPNELVLLFIHDAIRNHGINAYSYVYTMVDDFIKEHRFLGVKNTSYGNQKVYQIKFRKTETPFQVRGTIYIDETSFAIRRLDYAVFKQKLDDEAPGRYSSLDKDLLYEILVEYKDFEGRMYLNYISFHNQFKLVRPPKFSIENVIVNPTYRYLQVFLNKPPANWYDLKKNDFQVRYRGKLVKIESAYQTPGTRPNFIIRFPKKNPFQRKLLNLLFSKTEDVKKASLSIIVEDMVDASGNPLGERKSETMDQFREFFAQKILKDSLDESSAVFKEFPLGHPKQPKLDRLLGKDFWMNTPLKNNPQQ